MTSTAKIRCNRQSPNQNPEVVKISWLHEVTSLVFSYLWDDDVREEEGEGEGERKTPVNHKVNIFHELQIRRDQRRRCEGSCKSWLTSEAGVSKTLLFIIIIHVIMTGRIISHMMMRVCFRSPGSNGMMRHIIITSAVFFRYRGFPPPLLLPSSPSPLCKYSWRIWSCVNQDRERENRRIGPNECRGMKQQKGNIIIVIKVKNCGCIN